MNSPDPSPSPWRSRGTAAGRGALLAIFLAGSPALAGTPDAQYTRTTTATPWDTAHELCAAQGKSLCTRADVCPGTSNEPLYGRPGGDVWMAVGDNPNAWISIGQLYGARVCKTHEEVAGSAPGWGTTTGPQAVTGVSAALLCCSAAGTSGGARWGDITPKRCVNGSVRLWSAVLWDIPSGDSWEAACAATSATVADITYTQPTRCVNEGPGIRMWGEWHVPGPCSDPEPEGFLPHSPVSSP